MLDKLYIMHRFSAGLFISGGEKYCADKVSHPTPSP